MRIPLTPQAADALHRLRLAGSALDQDAARPPFGSRGEALRAADPPARGRGEEVPSEGWSLRRPEKHRAPAKGTAKAGTECEKAKS